MKITTFLLLIAIMQVSAATFAQNINLSESNASLKKLFKEIKTQSGYNFVYTEGELQNAKLVNIKVSSAKLDDVLQKIFAGQPLTYTISNNTVVVKEKELTILDKIRVIFSNIAGKITDEDGKPLPGVTVFDKTSKKGSITQLDGTFNILANKGDMLVFSFVGYKTKEVLVGEQLTINVSMEKIVSSLQDVVVIGYGTSKREDLTGSVSTVAAVDIQDKPFLTIDNALAGKAAGVQVTKADGSPGGAVKIRIRGSSSLLGGNDPLYVIDGVPIQPTSNYINTGYNTATPQSTVAGGFNWKGETGLSSSFVNGLNSLGGLNPDDIESITILKDASSTAIYGSKAANGVVIITTKRGKKDMAPQITASYYTTVSSAITPHLLNAQQFKSLLTEVAHRDTIGENGPTGYIPDFVNNILTNPNFFGTANTNWIKEVTRKAVSSDAELAVQGGGNASKYFTSISYNNTPGVVRGTDYQRVSGKINMENNIGKKFTFITNIILGYTNQGISDGAYGNALIARPDESPYTAAGNYTDYTSLQPTLGFQNPVALLSATDNAKTFSLLGSLSALYDITKDLHFKSTVSLNTQAYNQRNYMPSYLYVNVGMNYASSLNGIGSNSNSRTADWMEENTLSYNKTINKDNVINVLVGTSHESYKYSFFGVTAKGYPNDNLLNNLSSAVTPLSVTGSDPTGPQSYLLSFYARANYTLMDKYLFTFTGRSDGSSKFGPNNKYGYFPSGAIGWRISKEDFLKDKKWIDDIKLRGSYGLTGTQNIGDQMYRSLYTASSYNGASSVLPTQVGNPGIKWESTVQGDAGIDISLFNGRLQATADYYNKQTNGDLLSLPIAPSAAYSSLLGNVAGIRNRGFELSLDGDIIRTKDFKWNSSINITWNKSIVTKLAADADLTQIGSLTGLEDGTTALIQGQPLGLFTGARVVGIIKTQAQLDAYKALLSPSYLAYSAPNLSIGDPMFVLHAARFGTGETPDYQQNLGTGAPKYFGGFTQGFSYKNFDLQFYFTFSEGGHLLWSDHPNAVALGGTNNVNVIALNDYSATNPNAADPRLLFQANSTYSISNLDIFSSSYIKLRTLSLSYNFNKSLWMQKAGFKTAQLFLSATNLFTITKYPGTDPEISDDPFSATGGYYDASTYPTVRTFSIGLKAGF